MVENKIINRIEKSNLINRGEHVVIGLSGGPDSVCLFYVLDKLREEMNLQIYPVHINHKFRPGAAEADQEYCENLCRQMGYTCRSFVFDCMAIAKEKKMTSEEAGRLVRYDSFAKVAMELVNKGIPKESIKIAVAQNADDQAETVLFRLVRGAGIDGISGISYLRTDENGFKIIRPLLDVYKVEILEYCKQKDLNPCIDKTNFEEVYTRNKYRLDLIPHIEEKFNPAFKDALIRLAESARWDKEYLYEEAGKLYRKALCEETDKQITLSGSVLAEAPKALRIRVFSMALAKLGLEKDVAFSHFDGLESLLANPNPSARFDLPAGYYGIKVYENLRLSRAENEESKQLKFTVRIEEYKGVIQSLCPKEHFAAFDYDKMVAELGDEPEKHMVIEPRRSGDRIYIGENSSKKIQDYFVDAKIPKDDREKIWLLKYRSQVLWVLPSVKRGRYTSKYRVSNDTKKVIYIEI